MDKKVQKEINSLHQMIQNWKKDFLSFWTEEGPNEYLLEDFIEEISQWMMPYVRRLWQCEHITDTEYEIFMEQTRGEVEDLRKLLRLPEAKESTS